ncbi:peptidase [Siccibacter turicensis]|uniref:Peptidase n=1 Tax=Siccibacter turicensis TaxID=357233 RepID=A0A2P8VN96_9ENTR|nr:peptidase [Siccibacter turicensis]
MNLLFQAADEYTKYSVFMWLCWSQTDDYFLNRSDIHDHMLMIAKCSNLDHLL